MNNSIPMPSAMLSASMRKAIKTWSSKQVYGGYYKEAEKKYKDGETWVDNDGKEWINKNGINERISKLEGARMPLFCPNCNTVMNKKLDDKFYNLRGKCFNCAILEEQKMRINGTWEKYEKEIIDNNKKAFLSDYVKEIKSYLNDAKEQNGFKFVNDDGTFEKWTGNNSKMIEFLENELKLVNEDLEKIGKENE